MTLRVPLGDTRRFQQTSTVFSLPSPTGGWNRRDNLADMAPLDAITMDNFFPDVSGVSLRRGNTLFADSLSGEVETLFEFRSPSQTQFLASAGTTIYDITSGVSSEGTGFTNARWQTQVFNAVGYFVNGEDTPQEWDGTSLADTAFTGTSLTITDLINVVVSRGRLWFTEKDSGNGWYGGPGAVTGTLTKFAVGQVARAGFLMAVATWSRDSGAGQDDLTVFIMSSGEVLVYEGDPAATFTLIGLFTAPKPIGRRCFGNVGGELIIITRGGYLPLSALVNSVFGPEDTISDKIRGAVTEAVENGGALFGWQIVNHPDGIRTLFNVPVVENDTYQQHVFNNITGAWGRYTDLDANVLGEFDDDMYMGILNQVYRLDQGGIDESNPESNWDAVSEQWEAWGLPWGDGGSSIEGLCIQASNSLDQPNRPLSGRKKQVTIARPFVRGGGDISLTVAVLPDFRVEDIPPNRQVLSPEIVSWDDIAENWDVWDLLWGSGSASGVASKNLSVHGEGETFSVAMSVDTSEDIAWYNTDIIWKPGGML